MNEMYGSEQQGFHTHEWRVISRFQSGLPELLVICSGCKLVGVVRDPSPEEWQRAAEHCQWFKEQRIGVVGRVEAIDRGDME